MILLKSDDFSIPARRILFCLLAANALVRIFAAMRPLDYLDTLTIADDAYLSLTIARNIAQGHGPLYGTEFTNGFQPLYVFLMAPMFVIFSGDPFAPIRAGLFLLILFDTLTLYALYRFVASTSQSLFTPVVASVVWIVNPYSIRTSLNGLETSIAAFFLLASLLWFHLRCVQQQAMMRDYFFLGVLLGLATLARIDGAFLIPILALTILWMDRRKQNRRVFIGLLGGSIGLSLVVLPWLLYSYWYTADFYPISGKAVRFISLSEFEHDASLENLYFPILIKAVRAIGARNWVNVVALLLVIAVLRSRMHLTREYSLGRLKPVLPIIIFGVTLFVAYTGYIFTPWFFQRYFYPINLAIILTMMVYADVLFVSLSSTRTRIGWATGLLLVIVALNASQQYCRDIYFSTDNTSRGYMNLGLWAKREFKDGTTVGGQQTGALGYFANNLHVVNLDGVVNKSAYESLVAGKNIDYIKRREVQYIVAWELNIDLIVRNSSNFKPDDLLLVKRVEGFRSWHQEWRVWKVNYSN